MAFRATVVALACTFAVAYAELHPLSDEFIDLINSKQSSWKAGRNFPPNTPMEHLQSLLGVDPDFNTHSLPKVTHSVAEEDLPESFDPRVKWPNCPSLNEIRDQGSCSGSWAVAAVEVMTDRVCTYSNGTKQFHFSAEDLLGCCSNTKGCRGWKPDRAWSCWYHNGIVSGGNYDSDQGCKPYSFPSCQHDPANPEGTPCNTVTATTPTCVRKCNKNYKKSYFDDRVYGKSVYNVELEINIKAELMKNGPVEAIFWLYSDFYNYKSGVYVFSGGDFVGFHAVKLLGWGVENGTKYWLAANSWNSDWGDKGFFKILRGEDHLRIASTIFAGEPKLE